MPEEILDIIRKNGIIVIAGAGKTGMLLADEIKTYKSDLKIFFCDNNAAKHGELSGYIVTSMENAVRLYPKAYFFVASRFFAHRIKEQLINLGIEENKICCEIIKNELKNLEDKNLQITSLTPAKFLRFEIPLAEHCNLNCKWCAHFSSLADERYVGFEELEKDLSRLSSLLNGKSGIIYLMGGEPLLNKDIAKIIELTRFNFQKSRIVLLTNGILLLSMTEAFWKACRENKIVIQITKYPIGLEHAKIIQKIETEEIECDYFRLSDEECRMNKLPLDLEGKQNSSANFEKCYMANKCVSLKSGKLFTCPVVANIEHFNHFFGRELEVGKNDYVNIYEVNNQQELFSALATPIPFCRYCAVKERTEGHKWEISKKTIDEWISEER